MTTKPKRHTPKRTQKRESNGSKSLTPLDPTRPIGDRNPPVETQFQPGNKAAAGHTKPRKIEELKELIIETLSEDITDERGRLLMTRAQAMIRTMLVKSPTDRIALLEYAFGKVPDKHEIIDRRSLADRLGLSPEDLSEAVNQFRAILEARKRAVVEVKQLPPATTENE